MREDRLGYIEKQISQTPLYTLLGAEGIDELKHRIIDIICEQIQSDLKESYQYLICPDDIVQEAINEIKDEWKDKIKEYMSKKLEDMLK